MKKKFIIILFLIFFITPNLNHCFGKNRVITEKGIIKAIDISTSTITIVNRNNKPYIFTANQNTIIKIDRINKTIKDLNIEDTVSLWFYEKNKIIKKIIVNNEKNKIIRKSKF